MSQIEEVNNQIIEYISKLDPFYQALWGKLDFVPQAPIELPNDYRCGAFCNGLEYIYEYVREITDDFLNLTTPQLDIAVYFFAGIKRFGGDSDSDLISKMKSLLIRECDWRSERFGTPWDILNVLCYYVDRSFLFYVPNRVVTNLIINGGFEDAIVSEWTFAPSGDRSTADAFVGSYKVDFSGFTSLSQTVAVSSGAYILNAFVNPVSDPSGDTDIYEVSFQRDSDSYYYNVSSESWQVSDPGNTFTTNKSGWQLSEFFLISDGVYNIEIKFTKIVDFYMDRIEFGEKLYPSFEIIHVDTGLAEGFAITWITGDTNYDEASYLDQDYMFGSPAGVFSDTYFQEILNITKASGVDAVYSRENRT